MRCPPAGIVVKSTISCSASRVVRPFFAIKQVGRFDSVFECYSRVDNGENEDDEQKYSKCRRNNGEGSENMMRSIYDISLSFDTRG